jgi:hypothetical protein
MANWVFLRNVLVKAVILFIVLNLIFAIVYPVNILGSISLYNHIIPGRMRLPFGENPNQSFNLSFYNVDAMMASHAITGANESSEILRIAILGDSSVWGILLKQSETLAGALNEMNLECEGVPLEFYNLGYPTLSLLKDLMILDEVLPYDVDMVIWLVTLESFPLERQAEPPIVKNNPSRVRSLLNRYNLTTSISPDGIQDPALLEKTLVGQRRQLADLVRHQAFGVLWAATGIDQAYPADYTPAQIDLAADASFHGRNPPVLDSSHLAFEVLFAGIEAAGDRPVLIVNEPILISQGENSQIRYNFYYPRWAYDEYRELLSREADQANWNLIDVWNLIPPEEFTNSAIHLSAAGEKILAEKIVETSLDTLCSIRD